jgi:hypothetical protein
LVTIMSRLRTGRPENGIKFPAGPDIVLLSTSAKPALGPTKPPIRSAGDNFPWGKAAEE